MLSHGYNFNIVNKMKLYVFESCPYCIKVRALLGLLNQAHEIVYVSPSNFPEQLKSNLSKLTVPVLELENTDIRSSVFIQGSDEIMNFICLDTTFSANEFNSEVGEILSDMADALNKLCYPRMLFLKLPELASTASQDYFRSSREALLGHSLEELLEKTETFLPETNNNLEKLAIALDTASLVNGSRIVHFSDIAAFSKLRLLSMVAELEFSTAIKDYFSVMSELTGIISFNSVNRFGNIS